MRILKAKNVTYDYKKYVETEQGEEIQETSRALDDVSLDIKEGQFVAVLGHNGSGKSTFAKHINALLLPTEGTVWLDQVDTSAADELWQVRQKAGMVFQNPDNQIIGSVVAVSYTHLDVYKRQVWERFSFPAEQKASVWLCPMRRS